MSEEKLEQAKLDLSRAAKGFAQEQANLDPYGGPIAPQYFAAWDALCQAARDFVSAEKHEQEEQEDARILDLERALYTVAEMAHGFGGGSWKTCRNHMSCTEMQRIFHDRSKVAK